jgi:hypothetical protein
MAESTDRLSRLLELAIGKALTDVHTCLPGRVESFDPATGTAKVVPLLRRKYAAESAPVSLPVISGVPVVFPRAGGSWIRVPIAAGDGVLLVFSERSLDRWMEKGGQVDPEDPAKFSLNDAVAIPGLYAKPDALSAKGAQASLEIVNGNSYIEVTSDGTVKITAAKVVLTSDNVNLGSESGSALALKSDLDALVVTAPNGPCTVSTAACVGTLKVKGS